MKAFILKDRGNAVITEQAPAPVLKEPYGAILEPVAMAPCTSDVNTVYGTGSRKPDNLILGHECVARVLETASGVRDVLAEKIIARMCSHRQAWEELTDRSFLPSEMKRDYKRLLEQRCNSLMTV